MPSKSKLSRISRTYGIAGSNSGFNFNDQEAEFLNGIYSRPICAVVTAQDGSIFQNDPEGR